MGLTLQRDLAKFFFSCSETVAWMFRSLCLPVIQQCSRALLRKRKKTLTTNICISCCSHICFLLEGIYYEEEKTFATNICICCFQFMYLFFAQGHSYQAKNFNLQYLYLYFLSMYLYFAQGHSYDGGKHQHWTLQHLCVSILDSCVQLIVMRWAGTL